MKNLSLIIACAAFTLSSCGLFIKEPTACIEVFPSNTVEVFEVVQLSSCSENAAEVEWSVEQPGIGEISKSGESTTSSWDEDGTYSVKLTAISEKDKHEDNTTTSIKVEDVCYICEYNSEYFNFEEEYCYSEFKSKDDFEDGIEYLENNDYSCTKK